LLGLWDGTALRFCGSVGSGFDTAALRAIRAALDEMHTMDSPFHPDPGIPKDATFVNPHLVAEIAYKQWTAAGRLRAPAFKGFSDRPHTELTWTTEGPTPG
jgi:bifunctional non-homologous end joining protein LigD